MHQACRLLKCFESLGPAGPSFRTLQNSNGTADKIEVTVLGGARWLTLLLISANIWCLDTRLAITQFGHDVWTSAQGLPQDSIRAIEASTKTVQYPDNNDV